jgi:tetratricopeptide (TPR) repeat protein
MSDASDRSRWPTSADIDNRLYPNCHPRMNPKFSIAGDARVFAIGSCFARNIEEYLVRLGLDVISRSLEFPAAEMSPNSRRNDLLVKYTPPSILQELRFALDSSCPADEQFRFLAPLQNGRTVDLNIPTWYSSVEHGRAVERRREINALFAKIKSAELVIITLGLVEAWYDLVADGFICEVPTWTLVNEYPGRFAFVRLDYAQSLRYTRESIELILKVNPNAKIVLTTSPVPLGRTYTQDDIIVANSYSKSILRAVAGEISSNNPMVDYFPSYEMVMLSDPRASWSSDQRHVTDYRVGDVVRTFIVAYIPEAASEIVATRKRYMDAKVLFSKRQYAEALREFQAIAPHFTDDTLFLNDLRLAAECAGDWALMLEAHHALDRVGGRNIGRDISLANCFARLGRHKDALAMAESIGPDDMGALLVKIDALIALSRRQEAGELATSILKKLQEDPPGELRHDWVYIRLDRSFQALGAPESATLVKSIAGIA